ncbi:hypothetical protein D3C73_1081660 [compost metagenome]
MLVQRLARDFLGDGVLRGFLDRVRTPVTPPGKLTVLAFRALLDHRAHRVRKPFVPQTIHHHAGDRFHVGCGFTLGLPIDGTGKAGDGVIQWCRTGRIDRLHLGGGNGFGLGHRHITALLRRLLFEYFCLVFCSFLFLFLFSRRYLAAE